ncbi:hypothetical protein [Plantactinospora sonchi]|uniref:DUF5642 domain-containing protein n=1 Tax=Plantactinospora sonchi TaxID=1544735 RepID=A0ABU7S442_9ACTN
MEYAAHRTRSGAWRRTALVAVLLTAGCTGPQPTPVVPPSPPGSVPPSPGSVTPSPRVPGPPYDPEALFPVLTAIAGEHGTVPPPEVMTDEQELDGHGHNPCGLLTAEERPGEPFAPPTPVFTGLIEVNPTGAFQGVDGPTTVVEIEVTGFASDGIVEEVMERAGRARCATDFTVTYTPMPARRAVGTVRLGEVQARLSTGTVRRVPADQNISLVPGEARLVFAHGPLLISVDVLTFRPDSTGPKVTGLARKTAVDLATELLRAVGGGD